MSDTGSDTVGHALLITGIGAGTLVVAQLAQFVVHGIGPFLVAFNGLALN